jgi:acyl carrier protein
MELMQEIKREIAIICAFEPHMIRDDAWLIEYGLDSMSSIELINALEARFAIQLPNEELASLVTVSDVMRLVQQQIGVS